MKKREAYIDILKVIGLAFIILAHVDFKNPMIMQTRSFDVPLMCILSGVLAVGSYDKEKSIVRYIIKRINRLVIPTWIFLTVYFFVYFFAVKVFNGDFYPIKAVIGSYLLTDGIGYVWIIRVYLICAIITPFIMKALSKYGKVMVFLVATILYIAYEIMYVVGGCNQFYSFKYILWYLIPYGVVMLFGMLINYIDDKLVIGVGISAIIVYIVMAIYFYLERGQFVLTNEYKYPPRFYYLFFAVGVSLILIYIFKRISWKEEGIIIKISSFISKNSLWIYLIHIFFVVSIQKYFPTWDWKIQYLLICMFSIVCVLLKNKIIYLLKLDKYSFCKYLKG